MTTIIYCANGCVRRHGDEHYPATTEAPSLLCGQCEDRLHTWLNKIPDTYALLPTFIEHGAAEKNPDSKTTKTAEAPAPMRLEIIDLLDTRLGRKWNGTAPADDRRGTIGTLRAYVGRLADERPLTTKWADTSVTEACALLDRHRLWIAEQEWITDLYEDLRVLNRQLSDAIGDYKRPSVGTCPGATDDTPCAGKLYANQTGGVRCTTCHRGWGEDDLAFLGRLQAEADPTEATAADIAMTYGIKQSTIRTWAERGKVTKRGRNARGQQLYDVAQARALHDTTDRIAG